MRKVPHNDIIKSTKLLYGGAFLNEYHIII